MVGPWIEAFPECVKPPVENRRALLLRPTAATGASARLTLLGDGVERVELLGEDLGLGFFHGDGNGGRNDEDHRKEANGAKDRTRKHDLGYLCADLCNYPGLLSSSATDLL